MDASSNAYAVWADCRNGNGNDNWDIYFANRPAGSGWGANLKVNDDAGTSQPIQGATVTCYWGVPSSWARRAWARLAASINAPYT